MMFHSRFYFFQSNLDKEVSATEKTINMKFPIKNNTVESKNILNINILFFPIHFPF